MRITHVTDVYLPRLGGIEVHVAELARRQQLAGHAVSVLTATATATAARRGSGGSGGSAGTTSGDRGDGAGVPVQRFGGRASLVVGWAPGVGRRMSLELLGSGTDLVHVHLGGVAPTGWAAIRAAGQAGIPLVVTVHSRLDGLRAVHQLAAAAYGWRRSAPVWTAVGQRVAEQLEQTLRLPAGVAVIPNAVDGAYWRPRVEPAVQAEVLLVSALRHTRRKRAEALVDILAQVRQQTPASIRLRAVVAGDGPRRTAIEHQLRRDGLSDWVHLPGRMTRDELRRLYHLADVFVAPTRLESFGIAALEAREAGLPVVALADSGTAEVLAHGREAFLERTDADLARATARLAGDPGLRARIATHNRTVASGFDWDRSLRCTYRAYAAAMAASPVTVDALR